MNCLFHKIKRFVANRYKCTISGIIKKIDGFQRELIMQDDQVISMDQSSRIQGNRCS